MYNILICDDEMDIVNALKIYLNDSEYQFFEAYNGKQALEVIEQEEIHLVLLDIMMLVMDGMETLNKIRQFSNVPVIFLTAKSEEVDMISLTPTEYEILKLLMEHPGEVFSPKEIYRQVWKDNPLGTENIVAVHVRHIREKIEIDAANPRYLKVIWGQGYKMEK